MRKHRRLTFRHIGQINVTNRLSGDPMGVVLDVSMGGLRLVTDGPLAKVFTGRTAPCAGGEPAAVLHQTRRNNGPRKTKGSHLRGSLV